MVEVGRDGWMNGLSPGWLVGWRAPGRMLREKYNRKCKQYILFELIFIPFGSGAL
jgi:hypothetical protein